MKILDIYGGTQITEEEKEGLFPKAELTHIHIGAIKTEILAGYDIVIFNHSLMYLAPNEVPDVVVRAAGALNPNGELWMLTPSLEWAANCIVYQNESPALQATIYGIGGGYKTGYTIVMLRLLIEKHCELALRMAQQEPIRVTMKDGSMVTAFQNRVIGWKSP